MSVDPVSSSRTLGDLCGPACTLLNGQTAPVPAFTGSFTSSQSLPAEVISATVSGGSIEVEVTNGFGFDPLTGGGTITIEVKNRVGWASLGQIALDPRSPKRSL